MEPYRRSTQAYERQMEGAVNSISSTCSGPPTIIKWKTHKHRQNTFEHLITLDLYDTLVLAGPCRPCWLNLVAAVCPLISCNMVTELMAFDHQTMPASLIPPLVHTWGLAMPLNKCGIIKPANKNTVHSLITWLMRQSNCLCNKFTALQFVLYFNTEWEQHRQDKLNIPS